MTEIKFYEYKTKLSRLRSARPRLIAEVQRLAADGDFSENAAYQIAKGRLRGLNRRIDETEFALKHVVIIRPDRHSGRVQLGSKVTVERQGRQKTWTILGSAETDPSAGTISHNSPLGAALMGHGVGESVKFVSGGRETEYLIVKVE